uniref:Uncharacterized protein n=1 Tax=Arundo donax TaxID=35708 RepID=A0A0A9QJJ4_ARUDO
MCLNVKQLKLYLRYQLMRFPKNVQDVMVCTCAKSIPFIALAI